MFIWKTVLNVEEEQAVFLPKGSKILSVQVQQGVPCMWFQCEPGSMQERRTIRMIGTGLSCSIPDTDVFLGTVQLENGYLVLHVFEQL